MRPAIYCLLGALLVPSESPGETTWKKHVVDEGRHTTNVVAADFTGDGQVDVMANSAGPRGCLWGQSGRCRSSMKLRSTMRFTPRSWTSTAMAIRTFWEPATAPA